MPYAEGRIFNDADSHIMETRDWLISHADPDIRPKLHPLAIGSGGRMVKKRSRMRPIATTIRPPPPMRSRT